MKRPSLLFALLHVLSCTSVAVAQEQASDGGVTDPATRVFQLMLPSEHLLGDWGGVRSDLEDFGITPGLILVTDVAGNPSGGRSQGATAPTSVELNMLFDLDKISHLSGGTIFTSFSERWGNSLSADDIGNVFSAQQIYGFQTYRVIDVSYQQQLLNDLIELRIGRFATTDDFQVSAYNAGLVSNAFCGNPFGILLDAPGMTAYTGTWAALVKVNPTPRSYVMAAVYNGDPGIRTNAHHGMDLSLNGPAFSITEIGHQLNGLPGDSQLLGNYKLGGWYDASELTSFASGATTHGSWGLYAMFDQVLVPFGRPGSNSGFGIFGSVTVAPESHIQPLPLFLTAGFAARGMFESRPRDTIEFGVAAGYFSSDLQRAEQMGQLPGPPDGQDYEKVVELTYRFDSNGAFFVQPDVQYVVHPGGTGDIKNATVLGVQLGINF
ncbi:MAG TPA: carbohydrate porin [Rhizomicrobium sp.]|jgi:porin|nr:carbohydrate porin [Rhizomicrobium sp.]